MNLDIRVDDIRLRGRGFTLYEAAKEKGIPEHAVEILLYAMCNHFEKGDKSSPYFEDTLDESDLKGAWESFASYKEAERAGLVEKNDSVYTVTEKAVDLLKRAAEIQKKLDDEGFYYCPCHSGH